mgnify:CR=1 FL=1
MTGLTDEQVNERIAEGKVNADENPNTRTYKQIIRENTLTFFNFLNLVLLVLVLLVGSYKNAFFVCIIVINTLIGIAQEIRAKKTIDKLAILTARKSVVIREGQKWTVPTEELVLDDVVCLKNGDQVPADARVLEGSVEVNESLLTGESDNLPKNVGDELFSGSFVTSGEANCQIIHVGKDNYAAQITSEAKEFKRHNSELKNSLNAILKVISIIIVPIGALLFYKQYYIVGDTFKDSIVSMVAGVLGMIPEGLVLLTSVALTLGALVLANKKTLVQELYCIETLARVDTLCLDKTGTITEGTMCVERVEPYRVSKDESTDAEVDAGLAEITESAELTEMDTESRQTEVQAAEVSDTEITEVSATEVSADETDAGPAFMDEVGEIMCNMMYVLKDQNATIDALRKRFPAKQGMTLEHVIPFSSDRKYSGAVFEEKGTYLMGAAQFLFPEDNQELTERCQAYAEDGLRVLVLAHSSQMVEGTELPEGLEPLALMLLTDVIREEAPDTLAFFESQEVDLKVISGDDPVTVAAIAKRAGLKNADRYVDATTLTSDEMLQDAVAEYSVFGRVTPQQKKAMVQALQSQGHTVAMTGDGVNDVLALKEADCSIAMASGSDAAAQASQLVLLESDFSCMPEVVLEGRRVVNNIQRSASLFLVKNIFSFLLSVASVVFMFTYPLEPSQVSLISMFTIGVPAFFLALEPNKNMIKGHFLTNVLLKALPAALTDALAVAALVIFGRTFDVSSTDISTAATMLLAIVGFMILYKISAPMNKIRFSIVSGCIAGLLFCSIFLKDLFAITSMTKECIMLFVVFAIATEPVLRSKK